MNERKPRRHRESKEEFENRLFPWMCMVSLILGIAYVAVSVIVDPWLFVFIPLGIVGLCFVGMAVLGIAAGLTTMISNLRDFMED